jgi:hypothetical protein
MKKIVICSTGLLTDRMLIYSDFFKTLCKDNQVFFWTKLQNDDSFKGYFNIQNLTVEDFPKVNPMKFRLQLLRRMNDGAWDDKKQSYARISFWDNIKSNDMDVYQKTATKIGKLINKLGLSDKAEKISQKFYVKEGRSPETCKRLKEINPDMVLIMNPYRMEEPGIAAESLKLGYKTYAFITTWDNLSTKNRFMFNYDGYFLWNNEMKRQLHLFYSYTKNKPVYVVGAPQFDVFKNHKFILSKKDFLEQYGFVEDKPVILYTLGSPNFINEAPGANQFLDKLNHNNIKHYQVILRPHPVFGKNPEILEIAKKYQPIAIQENEVKVNKITTQDESKIIEWVNTFMHADIVIHLSSTTAIDGFISDTPAINIAFDPSGEQNSLVNDINTKMLHYKLINENDCMIQAKNYDEVLEGIKTYLENPKQHTEGRKKAVELVVQYTDGKNGERFANAIIEQVNQ